MKLTKRNIELLMYGKQDGKQDIHWDDTLPGFGLRVYPSGKKSFVITYRRAGRKHIMVVGQYGRLTVQQARAAAKKQFASLTIGNGDPMEERKREQRGNTVADLCRVYLSDYAKPHKKSWRDDERRINKRVLPAWRNMKVTALKKADIYELHRRIGLDHPYEANRVVELLSKMLALAKDWGMLGSTAENPAHGIRAYREEKRDRWVTPEELPALAAAIDKEKNAHARYALWLYLLTGVRKQELLKARWTDVDWQRKELCLPETKSGRTHYVPLSAPAMTILSRIPRFDGNPFIIVGRNPKSHLVNIDKPWKRVRTAAGVEDVRLHDLRRTVGSWMAQQGNSLHLIGRVLNHADVKTTQVYARLGEDQARNALEQHGELLMQRIKSTHVI